MLEWVYGTIVSTAEKARDGAKRQLGLRPPTAQGAFDALLHCLEEQHNWEQRAKASKELLNQMLRSRKEADELNKAYNLQSTAGSSSSNSTTTASSSVPGDSAEGAAGEASSSSSSSGSPPHLPDVVILKMLKREALLTSAKLHALTSDMWDCQRTLGRVRSQIRHVRMCIICAEHASFANSELCQLSLTQWLPGAESSTSFQQAVDSRSQQCASLLWSHMPRVCTGFSFLLGLHLLLRPAVGRRASAQLLHGI